MGRDTPRLLIRAACGPGIGAGHVMRCLALAQEARDRGGRVVFRTELSASSALGRRLLGEGMALEPWAPSSPAIDARDLVRSAQRQGVDAVVVDGYAFDAAYQTTLHEAGLRQLWIDDEAHAAAYVAEVVLNQNPHATEGLYVERSPHTRLLLGPRYALLRQEFRRHAAARQVPERVRRLVVTLGGGDPDNITGRVVEALARLAPRPETALRPEVEVVVGALNPNLETLRAQCKSAGFTVRHAVDDMASLLAGADLAITAAGSTCWELAYLGLPAMVVTLADNQRPIAREVGRHGMALDLGWHTELEVEPLSHQVDALLADRPRRQTMASRGREWVDGAGPRRVLDALLG